jgi:hypothetical protein
LFEAVESFVELKNVVFARIFGRVERSRGLFDINELIDIRIEKSSFDVELMYMEAMECSKGEKESNRGSFDDWSEGIGVIDAGDLAEALGDKTCFVARCRGLRVFESEDESSSDDFAIVWSRDVVPCSVFLVGV